MLEKMYHNGCVHHIVDGDDLEWFPRAHNPGSLRQLLFGATPRTPELPLTLACSQHLTPTPRLPRRQCPAPRRCQRSPSSRRAFDGSSASEELGFEVVIDALLLDELVPRMHVRGHLASGLRHYSAALGRCAALFLQRVCRNSRLAAFRPIDLVERGLDSSSGARV